ncbi:type IV pilus modification PilV family protein [Youngiibacter multivorans]|uniref:Prepilin-type N-terminal cleavage/methylation domain-containing protein n=1 Tax=Youngiibacter multivorans TaxID=937251 RepID=A0ABS4G7N7_9CLOT|nr:type II secretion system protein [Youngiibacter multivorans]MBP1920572.1 prepilin-type N-terminal cleavage/methylation domain-containing protein [Youngiibacter multivorans]
MKKVKGYSLIETIVALAIASLLVVGFYSLSNSLLKARDSSRIAQEALTLAENRIESLLAEPDNLSVSPSGVFITDQEVDGFILDYRILSGADEAVVSDEAGEVARLYTVEVKVTYGNYEKKLSTKYYAFRK